MSDPQSKFSGVLANRYFVEKDYLSNDGAFSVVYKALDSGLKKYVAIKRVTNDQTLHMTEGDIMRELRHPNVI